MTVQFESEEVRRRFLNDLAEQVTHAQDQGGIAFGSDPFYNDSVSYTFPDQPYFATCSPGIYYNLFTINQANQAASQCVSDSKYGEDWRCCNPL